MQFYISYIHPSLCSTSFLLLLMLYPSIINGHSGTRYHNNHHQHSPSLVEFSPSSSSSSAAAAIITRSDGRKFPILRALVSQFISDRSSRDSPNSMPNKELEDSPSIISYESSVSSPPLTASSSSSSSFSSSLSPSSSSSIPTGTSYSTPSSIRITDRGVSGSGSSISKSRSHNNNNQSNNVKSIQHIIEDINSQNSKISTKRRKRFLVNILSRMLKSVNFTELSLQMRNGISSRASCWACNALAGLFLSPVYSKEMMTMAVNTVCMSFRLQSPRVCSGIVDSFKDDLDYIRTHTTLKHGEMCGVIFGMDCARKITKNLNWTISIPERSQNYNKNGNNNNSVGGSNGVNKRTDIMTMDNIGGEFLLDQSSSLSSFNSDIDIIDYNIKDSPGSSSSSTIGTSYKSLIKLVQITDIHVDPYYEPGSEAQCGEPLCCRSTNGLAKNKDRGAGIWGDYRNCDTPVQTLRHVLKHINEMHSDAEYWIWTGDVAPHDIWNVTKQEVISQMKLVTNLIKQYARVPVYPVIGNHEGVPVNSFPPPEIKGSQSISWLYDSVAEEWAFWLPDDALQTLRYGGYYTVKPRDKLRVICINTNYCARLNPWSLYNPVDPANQLKWLSDELHKAEQAGDKVHIIGHIPPDNRECTQAWLYNFLRIIDRFNDTVLAQYYGHTHRDEYRLFYSPGPNEIPIGLAYIGPSITPFTENNPAYRLYYMEDNGILTDHETYYFNLTEANNNKDRGPQWIHEYRAMEKFGLDDMSPDSWHNLSIKLQNDDKLFNEFKNLYYRHSDVKKDEKCTDRCKKYILSDLAVLHPLKNRPKRFFGRRKHSHSK